MTANQNNFGNQNGGATLKCEGVYQEKNGKCARFSASSCPLRQNSTECFDDWRNLSLAVESSTSGGVFRICSNTVLDVDQNQAEMAPIVIQQNGTVIQCGDHGNRSDSCVISGGDIQFRVIDSPTGVIFSGLTHVLARKISIDAAGTQEAEASVLDGEFMVSTCEILFADDC